jgi:hypothetical protein
MDASPLQRLQHKLHTLFEVQGAEMYTFNSPVASYLLKHVNCQFDSIILDELVIILFVAIEASLYFYEVSSYLDWVNLRCYTSRDMYTTEFCQSHERGIRLYRHNTRYHGHANACDSWAGCGECVLSWLTCISHSGQPRQEVIHIVEDLRNDKVCSSINFGFEVLYLILCRVCCVRMSFRIAYKSVCSALIMHLWILLPHQRRQCRSAPRILLTAWCM